MDIFKGQNLLVFTQRFKTEEDCKKYLSELKWNRGSHAENVAIREVKYEKTTPEPATSEVTRKVQRLHLVP